MLDENVVILAQEGKDQFGRVDSTCLDLLVAIERNCHSLALTPRIWGQYARQAGSRGRRSASLVALIALLNNSKKGNVMLSEGDWREMPEIDGLPGVDVGDREFVWTAAAVPGSVLVTTDNPLRSALVSNGLDQTYGFLVVSPDDALAIARVEHQ